MISAAKSEFLISLTYLLLVSYSRNVLDVRQHCHGWFCSFNFLDWVETLHVTDTVDNRIDFPSESLAMFQHTFASTNLDLPSRIEKVGTRKNNVGVIQIELRSKTHQSNRSEERRV